MTRIVTLTCIPGGGGDYSWLPAITALQWDLVAMDICLRIECYGGGNLGSPNWGGAWRTDDDHWIDMVAAPGHRHEGVWDDGAARIYSEVNGPRALTPDAGHLRVRGLQIDIAGATVNKFGIQFAVGASGGLIDGCIVRSSTTAVPRHGIWVGDDTEVRNCLVLGWQYGIYMYDRNPNVYSNTVAGCASGYHRRAGTPRGRNNLAVGCADGYYNLGGQDWDFCASDLFGDARGANSRNGQIFTFLAATESDFRLSPTDTGALGWGQNLSSLFTADISGLDRGGWWDIGASAVIEESSRTRGEHLASSDFAALPDSSATDAATSGGQSSATAGEPGPDSMVTGWAERRSNISASVLSASRVRCS